MFPLYTKKFPDNAVDLAVLLNDSVKRVFSNAANPVVIRDKSYPELSEIRISLERCGAADGSTAAAGRERQDFGRPSSR
jgi:hypothetical protein